MSENEPIYEEEELDSILNSTKKKLGAEPDYDHFNHDIITEINMNLATLYQVGVGNKLFTVTSEDETWEDYYDAVHVKNRHSLQLIKEYVYLGTKLIFDPPESSSLSEAYKAKKEELEWRIYLDEDLID